MWSPLNFRSPAFALAMGAWLSLGGCGFAPVYGDRSGSASVKAQLSGVRVEAPDTREGQLFRHRLLELLGGERTQPDHPLYALNVTLEKEVFPIHVLQNRKVTRFRVHVRSKYTLKRLADGIVLDSGELVNSGGYDRVESDYATYVSGRAVGERGMISLADDYRQTLVNFFMSPEPDRAAPPAAVSAPPAPKTPENVTPVVPAAASFTPEAMLTGEAPSRAAAKTEIPPPPPVSGAQFTAESLTEEAPSAEATTEVPERSSAAAVKTEASQRTAVPFGDIGADLGANIPTPDEETAAPPASSP